MEKTVWGGAVGSGCEKAECEGLVEVQEAGGQGREAAGTGRCSPLP